jgi:hypothetical protein
MRGARVVTRKDVVIECSGQASLGETARDPQVQVRDGAASLLRRLVLVDEMGNCNARDVQPICGRTWARKDLLLPHAEVAGARVCCWVKCEEQRRAAPVVDWDKEGQLRGWWDRTERGARLTVEVNGHCQSVTPAPELNPYPGEDRIDDAYWELGWRTVPVPPEWLHPGANTVILRAEDGSRWSVLLEQGRWPNRSARSVDAGRTWDWDRLGYNECSDGEILVRMEMDCHPPEGRLSSPALDLAAASGDPLGMPLVLRGLSADCRADTPPGTSVALELRAGGTPGYDPESWSSWQPAEAFVPRPGDRYAQWQAVLRTGKPLSTPVLRAVRLTAAVEEEPAAWGRLAAADNPAIVRPSRPFGLQAPTWRALMLRQRWNLDTVVAGAADDFEKIVRLAHWTREQWSDGWRSDLKDLHVTPPWDAALILTLAKADLAQGMCTHFSTVFVHCCAALGIPARHLICKAHCSAEAWSDRFRTWVWVDCGGDPDDTRRAVYHVERNGVPLSALAARAAWAAGDLSGVRLVGRRAQEAFRLEARLAHLQRLCIPGRNDQMTSLSPGEPEHGALYYHYDGYLWWRAPGVAPLSWFSLSSDRAADWEWTPNRTRIHLRRMGRRGVLAVQLESSMASRTGFQEKRDEGAWRECPAESEWALHPGENVLAARSLSAFGGEGPTAWVRLTLEPA